MTYWRRGATCQSATRPGGARRISAPAPAASLKGSVPPGPNLTSISWAWVCPSGPVYSRCILIGLPLWAAAALAFCAGCIARADPLNRPMPMSKERFEFMRGLLLPFCRFTVSQLGPCRRWPRCAFPAGLTLADHRSIGNLVDDLDFRCGERSMRSVSGRRFGLAAAVLVTAGILSWPVVSAEPQAVPDLSS